MTSSIGHSPDTPAFAAFSSRMLDTGMIADAPDAPGVYRMIGDRDELLYVGKAKNLKSRLRSYLNADDRPRIRRMVRLVQRVEWTLVFNESEAFILENTLIKQHMPPYNTLLRDDKTYPFVRFDLKHPFPRLRVLRRVKADGARYFGPYVHGTSVFRLVRLLERLYPLRTCSDRELAKRSKPCIEYDMGNCLAPCVWPDEVRDQYQQELEQVLDFFRGRPRAVIERMKARMRRLSDQLEFEQAAEIRDRLRSIESLIATQAVLDVRGGDYDVYWIEPVEGTERWLASALVIRDGKLSGSWVRRLLRTTTQTEALQTIVAEYIGGLAPPAGLICNLEADADIREVLEQLRVEYIRPQRGQKRRYLDMARLNLHKQSEKRNRDQIDELRQLLGLERIERIECYDISAFQGSYPIGAMSVWEDGDMHPAAYRLFRLDEFEQNDDFRMLQHTLERRFTGSLASETWPDLLVMDGGVAQLNMAQMILEQLDVQIALISISKGKADMRRGQRRTEQDQIHFPGRKNALQIRPGSAWRIVQRLRDEAHRFGVKAHTRGRDRQSMESDLSRIPGIGPKRLQRLLQEFSSPADMLEDSPRLCGLLGQDLAQRVQEYIRNAGS